MKKSKVISLVLLLFLVLALTLIPSGNVSALGVGDFFLTDEELPSGWERYPLSFTTWPGPHMALRTKLMGGSWAGKMYSCRDGGGVTVCVGYYATEEEAKKLMYPDVYIYETDIYAATGHQGTTLSEWAQQSTEYKDCSFSSGTAYGDEGFTAQHIHCTIYGGNKTVSGVYRENIFRIRNVIFHVMPTASLHTCPESEGVIDPLLEEKARRLLGEEEPVKMDLTVSTDNKTYSPGETVIIRGSVWDANTGNPLEGAKVSIDVEGSGQAWTLAIDEPADYLGDYRGEFPLPSGIPQDTYTVTVTASKDGYPDKSDTTSIIIGGQGLDVGIDIAKEHYDIGETTYCTISVWNVTADPVSDANLTINVTHLESGKSTEYSGVTNDDGQYIENFTWSGGHGGSWQIEVTASKEGYRDGHDNKSITVGGEFKVSLETDKENYAVGDVIKINGVVTSPDPIGSDLELNLEIRIYDSSGSVYRIQRTFIHSDGSYNEQIKIFGENKPGPWGQEGEIGKWRIEAITKKTGYPDAKADKNIVVQGCGDQLCQNDKGEYCYNCSIDCKCEHGEICDPFGEYTNPKTKCSPKVAYIVVSSDVSVYEFYWVLPRVNHMRKYYRSRNYQTISILMGDKDEVFEALSYPSTKAIAYFGHAGVPSIEGAPVSSLRGTIYGILMKKYRALGLQKNEAINKANERANQPNLDYAYIHTCHSLDDTSLANYLLRSRGTYWGERGILTSTCPLEKYVKP